MSASAYKKRLFDVVASMLWQQWISLGVAGHGEGEGSAVVLDPEALLIFSASFCRYDSRLYDLVATWLVKYSRLLNPVRLKTMVAEGTHVDLPSLAYLAALCVQAGDKRWQKMAEAHCATGAEPQSMFLAVEDAAGFYCRQQDELALRYGFIRPPFENRNKICRRLPLTPATLLLRARGWVGSTARAEVIVLLLQSAATIQQLSARSGFVRSAVKSVLDEFMLTDIVSPVKLDGRGTSYTLNDKKHFRELWECPHVHFPCWKEIFNALADLWQLVSSPAFAVVSQETFHGELRRLFRARLRPRLLNCGVNVFESLTESSIIRLPELFHSEEV